MNEVNTIEASRISGEVSKRIMDRIVTWMLYGLLVVFALSLYVPVIWMFINSFKTDLEYYLTGIFTFAKEWQWSNYSYIFKELEYIVYTDKGRMVYFIDSMFINSILYAFMMALYPPIVGMVCAYIIARYRFPGRKFLYTLGIVLMILPIYGTAGTSMILNRRLGIYDNMFLLVLVSPSVAFSGFNFLIFHAGFQGIPQDFTDAARVDGANDLSIMLKIMFPMVISIYIMLALMGFVAAWNDWSTFLLWLPSSANIALGIYQMQYAGALEGATQPQVLAGFGIVAIPTVLMYVFAHPILMKNFNIGGLKG